MASERDLKAYEEGKARVLVLGHGYTAFPRSLPASFKTTQLPRYSPSAFMGMAPIQVNSKKRKLDEDSPSPSKKPKVFTNTRYIRVAEKGDGKKQRMKGRGKMVKTALSTEFVSETSDEDTEAEAPAKLSTQAPKRKEQSNPEPSSTKPKLTALPLKFSKKAKTASSTKPVSRTTNSNTKAVVPAKAFVKSPKQKEQSNPEPSSTKPPFTALPFEIRVMIYKHLVKERTPRRFIPTTSSRDRRNKNHTEEWRVHVVKISMLSGFPEDQLALLRAYFSENVFRVTLGDIAWLFEDRLGVVGDFKPCNVIQRLEVDVPMERDEYIIEVAKDELDEWGREKWPYQANQACADDLASLTLRWPRLKRLDFYLDWENYYEECSETLYMAIEDVVKRFDHMKTFEGRQTTTSMVRTYPDADDWTNGWEEDDWNEDSDEDNWMGMKTHL